MFKEVPHMQPVGGELLSRSINNPCSEITVKFFIYKIKRRLRARPLKDTIAFTPTTIYPRLPDVKLVKIIKSILFLPFRFLLFFMQCLFGWCFLHAGFDKRQILVRCETKHS